MNSQVATQPVVATGCVAAFVVQSHGRTEPVAGLFCKPCGFLLEQTALKLADSNCQICLFAAQKSSFASSSKGSSCSV